MTITKKWVKWGEMVLMYYLNDWFANTVEGCGAILRLFYCCIQLGVEPWVGRLEGRKWWGEEAELLSLWSIRVYAKGLHSKTWIVVARILRKLGPVVQLPWQAVLWSHQAGSVYCRDNLALHRPVHGYKVKIHIDYRTALWHFQRWLLFQLCGVQCNVFMPS